MVALHTQCTKQLQQVKFIRTCTLVKHFCTTISAPTAIMTVNIQTSQKKDKLSFIITHLTNVYTRQLLTNNLATPLQLYLYNLYMYIALCSDSINRMWSCAVVHVHTKVGIHRGWQSHTSVGIHVYIYMYITHYQQSLMQEGVLLSIHLVKQSDTSF